MITAAARHAMRRTQEAHMQHTCSIETYTVGEDGTVSYGKPFDTICGFDGRTGTHTAGSIYETAEAAATLRLPLGTPVGIKDRVTILTAYGEEITPMHFEVSRIPDAGPSAILAELTEAFL